MKKIYLFILMASFNFCYGQNTTAIANEIEAITYTRDWETAKQKVVSFYKTLPNEPNELQIVSKYEVSKLEKIIDSYLNKEKDLYSEIMTFGSLSKAQMFLEEFPFSSKRQEVFWKMATIQNTWIAYNKYLKYGNNKTYSSEAKAKMEIIDNNTYNNSIKIGSLEALNSYLENIPEGKYINQIKKLLSEKFEEEEFKRAMNSNTVSSYTAFLNKFPYGNFALKAKSLLEDANFDLGEKAFKKQNWQLSIDSFEQFVKLYPLSDKLSLAKNRINAAKRKLLFASKTINYFSYDYDMENQVGISFGMLRPNSSNVYMKIKVNKEIFDRGGILVTTDNSGYSTSQNSVVYTGDYQYNNWSGIMGINIPVYNPLWLYIGGGVLNRGLYLEAKEYDNSNNFLKTRWMKNTDQQSYKFVGEAGIAANILNKGIIKVGFSYYERKIIPQFGIGIGW
jgi:hypothetical protein